MPRSSIPDLGVALLVLIPWAMLLWGVVSAFGLSFGFLAGKLWPGGDEAPNIVRKTALYGGVAIGIYAVLIIHQVALNLGFLILRVRPSRIDWYVPRFLRRS